MSWAGARSPQLRHACCFTRQRAGKRLALRNGWRCEAAGAAKRLAPAAGQHAPFHGPHGLAHRCCVSCPAWGCPKRRGQACGGVAAATPGLALLAAANYRALLELRYKAHVYLHGCRLLGWVAVTGSRNSGQARHACGAASGGTSLWQGQRVLITIVQRNQHQPRPKPRRAAQPAALPALRWLPGAVGGRDAAADVTCPQFGTNPVWPRTASAAASSLWAWPGGIMSRWRWPSSRTASSCMTLQPRCARTTGATAHLRHMHAHVQAPPAPALRGSSIADGASARCPTPAQLVRSLHSGHHHHAWVGSRSAPRPQRPRRVRFSLPCNLPPSQDTSPRAQRSPCAPLVQAAVKTWALGADQRCAGSPAYDAAAERYFAAVHPATDGASASSTLLTWPRKAPGGSLKHAARAAQLPTAVHSLHAIPPPPGGSANAMEVDSSGGEDDCPAVFAVYASGAVAACSPVGMLSESHEARGLEPLAACAAPGGGLAVVHADARSGGASCSSYTLQVRLLGRARPGWGGGEGGRLVLRSTGQRAGRPSGPGSSSSCFVRRAGYGSTADLLPTKAHLLTPPLARCGLHPCCRAARCSAALSSSWQRQSWAAGHLRRRPSPAAARPCSGPTGRWLCTLHPWQPAAAQAAAARCSRSCAAGCAALHCQQRSSSSSRQPPLPPTASWEAAAAAASARMAAAAARARGGRCRLRR